MPHLRRHRVNNLDNPDLTDLRAQFHTPRLTPTHQTSSPDAFTPEEPPTVPMNPFAMFGRSRADRLATDDVDPRARGSELGNEPLDPDDSFDGDQTTGQFDDSDLEAEDAEINQSEDGDEEMHDREKSPTPLPPNLREISSLASWTVSSSKPGCGVLALRDPSSSQYWQSDGPQPHTLTLHFFKLVAVVRVRVLLDFELDESYTPTKMIFAAGMGGNDLVEFATWEGEAPCGWVDIELNGVGGRNGGWVQRDKGTGGASSRRGIDPNCGDTEPDHDDDDECEPIPDHSDSEAEDDPYAGNVLKAMVIQMRVMENHQNGKDTHVRGFQVFACDDSRRALGGAPSASADACRRRPSLRGRHDLRGRAASEDVDAALATGLDEPEWMGEPVIR